MIYFDVDRRRAGTYGPERHHSGTIGSPPGEKNAPEYIVSGIPFVTASTNAHDDGEVYELTFPMMTQWFQVQNPAGGALKLGFTSGGIAGTQYFTIPASTTTEKLYLRTKSIFIDSAGSGYSVIASLTGIPTGSAGDLENNTYWGV